MERDQVLAFRLARHGLTTRRSVTLAEVEAARVAALRGSEGAVVSWGAS